MAVAIWNHRPTADELLERRLAGGWKPTPSSLKDGERVLGHAACAVEATRAPGPSRSSRPSTDPQGG